MFKQAAKDFGFEFSAEVALLIDKNVYVDDCSASCSFVPDSIKTAKKFRELLAKANLTKWLRNSNNVLKFIPKDKSSKTVPSLPPCDVVTE